MSIDEVFDECELRWCNEAGEHTEHRQYLASVAVGRGRCVLGVNLVEPEADARQIELTVVPRHGSSVVVSLGPVEAVAVGESLLEAGSRQTRAPADSLTA